MQGQGHWRTVTISRDGSVSVILADGSTKTIQPSAGTSLAASAA